MPRRRLAAQRWPDAGRDPPGMCKVRLFCRAAAESSVGAAAMEEAADSCRHVLLVARCVLGIAAAGALAAAARPCVRALTLTQALAALAARLPSRLWCWTFPTT